MVAAVHDYCILHNAEFYEHEVAMMLCTLVMVHLQQVHVIMYVYKAIRVNRCANNVDCYKHEVSTV